MDPNFVSRIHAILTKVGFRECRTQRKGRGKTRYVSGYRGVKGYSDFRFRVTWDTPSDIVDVTVPDGTQFLGVTCERATASIHRAYAKALNDAGIPTVICGTPFIKTVAVWVAIPQVPEPDEE